MALTLAQRMEIATDTESVFFRQIEGALVKHAKWVLRTASEPEANKHLARQVIHGAGGFTPRFAAALLTEPVHDALTDVTTITDEGAQSTISELWPLFAED